MYIRYSGQLLAAHRVVYGGLVFYSLIIWQESYNCQKFLNKRVTKSLLNFFKQDNHKKCSCLCWHFGGSPEIANLSMFYFQSKNKISVYITYNIIVSPYL
jgi:hypothetical protein